MMLNELQETFDFLKNRIDEFGPYLEESETRTRQVLIDPLLKALGWDVSDPGSVELEHQIEKPLAAKGYQRADYALLNARGAPMAIIEAKRLGEDLDDALLQAGYYAWNKKIRWVVVTDGNHWKLYDALDPDRQLTEALFVSFSVGEEPHSTCALKSLALWNPNLVAKNGPVKAEKPVLKLKGGQPPPPPPGWSQLRDVVYRGKHDKLKGKLMCPNGEVIEVASWSQLYVAVADYLARSGDLARGNPPFGFTTGGRYAIAREPVHGSGEPFVTSRPLSGGYFLEANNGAYHSLDFTFRLIEKCKGGPNRLDANDFKFNRA